MAGRELSAHCVGLAEALDQGRNLLRPSGTSWPVSRGEADELLPSEELFGGKVVLKVLREVAEETSGLQSGGFHLPTARRIHQQVQVNHGQVH
jgi:hypothetical protein